MVRSIQYMAKYFDLKVVAEGVKTAEQFNIPRDNNCDIYRGYDSSRPLTYVVFVWFYNNQK